MELNIRKYNKEIDYNMITEWTNSRDMKNNPSDFLSEHGVIASCNGKDIASMWLYPIPDVKWCMIRFPISNPTSEKQERDVCLNLCLEALHKTAKDMNYTHVFVSTNTPPFEKRLKSWGYEKTDSNCSHYWGGL